jgi:hypothetical protein
MVMEYYLQWLQAFAATGRQPGSKPCSPLLLAARHGTRCYNLSPALLPKAAALLQYAASDATIYGRRCYNMPPTLLPKATGSATICCRRCYPRLPELLQSVVGAATQGHRSCYNLSSALLPKATGAATICPTLVLLSSSAALLQSFAVGAASGPALQLSTPRRLLRQLLRAEPAVATTRVVLQPTAPNVCYYGRHELL